MITEYPTPSSKFVVVRDRTRQWLVKDYPSKLNRGYEPHAYADTRDEAYDACNTLAIKGWIDWSNDNNNP